MLTMLAMGGLGIALHFLGRWGEHWRTVQKINAWHYVQLDPPGWLAAVAGSVGFWLALPEVDKLLSGLPFTIGQTPMGCLLAGYMGSSLGPKLLALVSGRVGVR